MIRLFAAHKTAANLLMLLFVAVGIFSLPGLRRETFPQIPIDEIEIQVVYPGATPHDIEDAICRRIEDAIEGVEDVAEVRAEALESLGRVTVKVVEGADAQRVMDDLRAEVEAIDDFPEEAEAAVIRERGRTEDVASIAVTGDMSLRHLKAYCEDLKSRLIQQPDVEIVDVQGFSDHQFRVEVPATALMQYRIGVADIAATIAQQSIDLPAGTLQTERGDVVLRFTDERRSPAELGSLTVLAGESGAEIRLAEIATITDLFERDEEKFMFNGSRAGLLKIRKTRAQDSLDVVGAIKRFIAEENAMRAGSGRLVLTQDSSSILQDRLNMLVTNGWQGMLLVFLVLWLFFNFRLSFWVAMSLPVSFLGGFFLMTGLGYSINMLTMVALLLALGLLMDDGIVLAENIATHRSKGKTPLQAAIDGTREVRNGVLSSFATTVVVFGPLAYLSGDIGAVLKVLPVVLILVLAVSLVEAFFILPGHLAHSLHHYDPKKTGRFRKKLEAGIEALRERVLGRAVDWLIQWRYLGIGLTLLIFLVSLGMQLGGFLKFQAFPDIDGDVVIARVLLPQGTPLGRTEQTVGRITEAFERVNREFDPRQPEGKHLKQNVSVQYNVNVDAFETGPNVATITVDLLSAEVRDASTDEILNRWREEVGEVSDVVSLQFTEPSFGPAGRAIEIRVQGSDFQELKDISMAIQAWFAQFDGVYDVFDDLRPGKPEIRVRLREGAASLGVNAKQMAGQLRAAFLGDTASEIQIGPEKYEVDVRLDETDRDSVADLEYFHVTLPGGDQVPVGAVATLRPARGHARIARVDGLRTVTVFGSVDPSRANVTELLTKFQEEALPGIRQQHPSVLFAFEGEVKNGEITGASLRRGLVIGLIGVFLLLSFQFKSYVEPLVVMAAIPMCFIGVIWGHIIMGLDLTLPSLLGFVSLAGVVVNDSILLVEFMKIQRRKGSDIRVAAGTASRLRFRAVLLTSITTIAGLVPLLTETSLQAQILIPLATSIVFGMISSTVLVLLIIPALYSILGDFRLMDKVEPAE